jgi:ABC-type multidrug transport system ATPase subunit
MSAEDLLDYFATRKGVGLKSDMRKLVKEILEITNLYDLRKKFVADYSGGMKQRFGIAQLLLNSPELIIVDEPTAALDPAERHRFLNILRETDPNCTVVFSTHIVDDVKKLCNEMTILNDGRILKHTTPIKATEEIKVKTWTEIIARDALETIENTYNILSSNYNQANTFDDAQRCGPNDGQVDDVTLFQSGAEMFAPRQ